MLNACHSLYTLHTHIEPARATLVQYGVMRCRGLVCGIHRRSWIYSIRTLVSLLLDKLRAYMTFPHKSPIYLRLRHASVFVEQSDE
jgi:hypothetical protein